MPIKFRCYHCKKFMGISRSKAGSVVDCPSCGRSVRVPELDGSVKPLPPVGLNLRDSSLNQALNQLAAPDQLQLPSAGEALKEIEAELRQLQTSPEEPASAASSLNRMASDPVIDPGVVAANEVIELPIPEAKPPIALSAANPPRTRDVARAASQSDSNSDVASVAASPAATSEVRGVSEQEHEEFEEQGQGTVIADAKPYDEDVSARTPEQPQLQFASDETTEPFAPDAGPSYGLDSSEQFADEGTVPLEPDSLLVSPPETVPIQPTLNTDIAPSELKRELDGLAAMSVPVSPDAKQWEHPADAKPNGSLLYVAAILILVVGFAIGQLTSGSPTAKDAEDSADDSKTEQIASQEKPHAEPPTQGLFGRITYRTALGDSFPDSGAKIIVLPRQANVEQPLQITGLRPADDEGESSTARQSVQHAGGDAITVADDGSFEIPVSVTGNYHVLILSRFHRRSDEEQIVPELKQALDDYFAESDHRKLLGQWGYAYGRVKIDGKRPVPWDHVFQ